MAAEAASGRTSPGSGAGPTLPRQRARARAPSWRVRERYDVQSIIGSGTYSSVCQAYDQRRKTSVAIKRVRELFSDLEDCKRILREVAILAQLEHECVVRVFDIFHGPDTNGGCSELYMVMEICDTDLRKLIRTDVTLTALHVKVLTYHLLRGLKYIHSAGVYHRDLKPPNCLVNEDCVVKITDFNLSRAVGDDAPHREAEAAEGGEAAPDADPDNSTWAEGEVPPGPRRPKTARAKRQLTQHVVSRWYRAPEVILLQNSYTEAIDAWSAGCIFGELLQMLPGGPSAADRGPLFPGLCCFPLSPHGHGRRPRNGSHDQLSAIFAVLGTPTQVDWLQRSDARRHVARFDRVEGSGLRQHVPYAGEEALELLEQALRFNPAERLTMPAALELPYFVEVRDAALETTARRPIRLEFEQEASLDEGRLRFHFEREIGKYRAEGEVDHSGGTGAIFAIAGA